MWTGSCWRYGKGLQFVAAEVALRCEPAAQDRTAAMKRASGVVAGRPRA